MVYVGLRFNVRFYLAFHGLLLGFVSDVINATVGGIYYCIDMETESMVKFVTQNNRIFQVDSLEKVQVLKQKCVQMNMEIWNHFVSPLPQQVARPAVIQMISKVEW